MQKKNQKKSKWAVIRIKQKEKEKIERTANFLGLSQSQYLSRVLTHVEQQKQESAKEETIEEECLLDDYFYLSILKNFLNSR